MAPNSIAGEQRHIRNIPNAIARNSGDARLPGGFGVSLATAAHYQILSRGAGGAPAGPPLPPPTKTYPPCCAVACRKIRWGHNLPKSPNKPPESSRRRNRSTGFRNVGDGRAIRRVLEELQYVLFVSWRCPRNRFLPPPRCRAGCPAADPNAMRRRAGPRVATGRAFIARSHKHRDAFGRRLLVNRVVGRISRRSVVSFAHAVAYTDDLRRAACAY